MHLTSVIKSVDVARNSYEQYEQVDDLFKQIRLCLLQVRQNDPVVAEELIGLVRQLEDWVESLVVNSLKLESLESMLRSTIQLAKRLRERTDRK